MKAREFDKKFEAGDDVLENLDKEANRLGVTRQAIIKVWLSERLERSESVR